MRWNQSIPLQLESEIIHGTFSMREKNVNHIVLSVLGGRFLYFPIPQLLCLSGAGPSQANWLGPKSFYMNLCHAKTSLSPIFSSPSPGKGPVSCHSSERGHYVESSRPLPNRKGEKTNKRAKAQALQRPLQRTWCKTKNKQVTSTGLDNVTQWLINISKNHHVLSEALELSHKPLSNHSWNHHEVQNVSFLTQTIIKGQLRVLFITWALVL